MFTREQGGERASTSPAQVYLGRDCHLTGTLHSEGPAEIEGQIEGAVTGHDTITIAAGAIVRGPIGGTTVVIHGRVEGDVTATEKVVLREPGQLTGDLRTPSLAVEAGAVFQGRCAMGVVSETEAARSEALAAIRKRSRERLGASDPNSPPV